MYAEDYGLWVSLAIDNYKFGNIPEILLNYRIHDGQVTKEKSLKMNAARSLISERYWKSRGLYLQQYKIIKIDSIDDLVSLYYILSKKNYLNNATNLEIFKLCLNSCHLGVKLWATFVRIVDIKIVSIKSLSLLFFCIIKNDKLPKKIKDLIFQVC